MEQTKKNAEAPSKELQQHANELLEIARVEPVDVIAAVSEDETESIEVAFFQRYLRTKKVTEQTGRFTQSLKTKTVKKEIASSWSEEDEIFTQFEEVKEPVIKDGKKQVKMKADVRVIEMKDFPFGKVWKVKAFFKPGQGDKLNMVIGKAVVSFKDELRITANKFLNLSQPVYAAVPVGAEDKDGKPLILSNYQLYGHRNKEAGLKGLNLTSKDKASEADFARTTLAQFETVIERMQGKGMEIAADWTKLNIQFPTLSQLKRTKKASK